MSVHTIVLIGFLILLLLFMLLTLVLHIFALIHCLLTEKDHTKKMFWVLAILVGGLAGDLLYIFLRLPRRKREAREPGYSSRFEESIMRPLTRRKVPSRKALLRKRRSERAMFAIMQVLFVGFILGMIALGISMTALALNGTDLDPLMLLLALSFGLLLIIPVGVILLFDPRRGWSEFLVIGMNKRDLTGELLRMGYEWNEKRLFFDVKQDRGIHVHLIEDDELIRKKMEMSGIGYEEEGAVLLLAFYAMRTWGDPFRLMSKGMFGIKSFSLDARTQLLEQLGNLEERTVCEVTFKESGLVKERASLEAKGK